jgi:hypothetical protein
MGMQMVYAQKSRVNAQRQGLGKGDANQKTAKKPGPARDGNNVNPPGRDPVALHKLVKERADVSAVLAGGQFRDNSSEKGMNAGLAGQNGINQIPVPDKGQRRFIAGSFYPETEHSIPDVKVDFESPYSFLYFA